MSGWNRAQYKAFAKDLKAAYPGKAWSLLVDELREAVLCERVLRIVLGQERAAVVVEDVQALYNGIRTEMGLLGLWIDEEHHQEVLRIHAVRKLAKPAR